MTPLLLPMSRALSQLTDPAMLGVVWRSVLFSALFFAAILFATIAAVHHYVAAGGLVAWALDALGSIAASVLAMWLFLPVAAIIGTLYFERIARAVERVYYPSLPAAQSAPSLEQLTVSLGVGLRVLGLNLLALLLTLLLPGIGLPIGWAVASWAMGRGLFVAVAMRRLNRRDTEALYRTVRPVALVQGAAMAAAAVFSAVELADPGGRHRGDGARAGPCADRAGNSAKLNFAIRRLRICQIAGRNGGAGLHASRHRSGDPRTGGSTLQVATPLRPRRSLRSAAQYLQSGGSWARRQTAKWVDSGRSASGAPATRG